MASIASASPFLHNDSSDETDSWQYVDTNSSPAGYIPSPTSSGFNGWGIVGYPNHLGTSPVAMSPLHLDHDAQIGRPPTSYPNQSEPVVPSPGDAGAQAFEFMEDPQFMANQNLLFPDVMNGAMNMDALTNDITDIPGFEGLNVFQNNPNLGIPSQFREDDNTEPWAHVQMQEEEISRVAIDPYMPSQPSPSLGSSSQSSYELSPVIPATKQNSKSVTKEPDPLRKPRGSNRVEKKQKPAAALDNFVVVTPDTINQQSGKPNPYECFEAIRGTHRGRTGPLANQVAKSALNVRRKGACFCCRSRKVKCDEERPCKNCTKISAQVPQIVCWQFSDFLPVLFPDFIRGHFKKEAMTRFITDNVAEFHDSNAPEPLAVELSSGSAFGATLTIPASFFTPNTNEILQHWHMGTGIYQLDLHVRSAAPVGVNPADSGQQEALKRRAREYVQNLVDEPRYAEQVTDSLRNTHLPRRILKIVQHYAQQSGSTMVKRALGIYVTHYVLTRQLTLTSAAVASLQHHQSQIQPIAFLGQNNQFSFTTARILNRQVKAVLDEYLLKETQSLFTSFGSSLKPRSRAEWGPCLAAFLVLCLLMESIEAAADTFMVSEAEIALRTRRPSTFGNGIADPNKVGGGGGFAVGGRRKALDVCREIDNLPFRQVAYRFHAVYQTHHIREPGVGPSTSTASTSGSGSANSGSNGTGSGNAPAAFNPLVDAKLDVDLDSAAAELALSLRALLENDWHELDFLVADPILSHPEVHPYPRDITLDYTGRLLARFLLSFTDEKYLFDGQF
ncbi:hypothetical protein F5Y16DRAFT_362935 [Xylariaceae sp. FL0255]|nr:hypothetical protein F5Y16DRAFT_362935 [Xylariaceae sp. FL0255]